MSDAQQYLLIALAFVSCLIHFFAAFAIFSLNYDLKKERRARKEWMTRYQFEVKKNTFIERIYDSGLGKTELDGDAK